MGMEENGIMKVMECEVGVKVKARYLNGKKCYLQYISHDERLETLASERNGGCVKACQESVKWMRVEEFLERFVH